MPPGPGRPQACPAAQPHHVPEGERSTPEHLAVSVSLAVGAAAVAYPGEEAVGVLATAALSVVVIRTWWAFERGEVGERAPLAGVAVALLVALCVSFVGAFGGLGPRDRGGPVACADRPGDGGGGQGPDHQPARGAGLGDRHVHNGGGVPRAAWRRWWSTLGTPTAASRGRGGPGAGGPPARASCEAREEARTAPRPPRRRCAGGGVGRRRSGRAGGTGARGQPQSWRTADPAESASGRAPRRPARARVPGTTQRRARSGERG